MMFALRAKETVLNEVTSHACVDLKFMERTSHSKTTPNHQMNDFDSIIYFVCFISRSLLSRFNRQGKKTFRPIRLFLEKINQTNLLDE